MNSEYTRNNPTPIEVHARQAFKGICFECQMIFATWKEPDGIGLARHERDNAHHCISDLDNCWCPLCKMLLHDLSKYNDEPLRALRSPSNSNLYSDVKIYSHDRSVTCYYVELVFQFDNYRLQPSFKMYAAGTGRSITGTIHSSTDCQSVWDLANKWLQDCSDGHDACGITYPDTDLPTRLLHVGTNNDDLRLVMSKGLSRHTEYTTLSHCWGTKPFMTLTRRNLDAFLVNIPFESLTKTFRDVIIATRKLGFRYLWIDSLCIIQGDEEDWQHEASRMSYVYSNSTLNFAAADSPDGDTGCFFDNRPDNPNAWKVTFPRAGPVPSAYDKGNYPSQRWRQYTWNCISSSTRAVIDKSHLASRAWTLQERLLSPRTLYFGRDQIAWECRACTAYEALGDLFDEGIKDMSPGNYFRLLDEASPLASEHNVRQWSDIVKDYSSRNLTLGRDKLVAISGLARILAPVYGTDYVAGLWVKDLIRLLVWTTGRPGLPVSPPKNETLPYRAPSWSWASVEGGVAYPRGFAMALEGEDAEEEDDFPPLAKVLEAVTTYPEDQFGEVTSGFVRLRVWGMFRVTIDSKKWIRQQRFPVHVLGLGEIKEFAAYPDYNVESIDGESLLIPLLNGARDYPYDYPEVRGLFLEHVEGGVYRRKGSWRIGGEYSESGFKDYNQVVRTWQATREERVRYKNVAGLDEKEFEGLWDGEAYVLKLI